MKLLLKDIFKLTIILILWYIGLNYCHNNKHFQLYEALKYFPFHLVVTIGYYAIISVCYKILFIKDCEKEHKELVDEINEAKEFFIKNNVKYN
jgi:hypothetical protein